MLQLESKTSIVKGKQEKIFEFLTDFRNMEDMLPKEMMHNLVVDQQTCRFEIRGIGPIGLKMAEKNPWSEVKIRATEESPADFTLMINLNELPDELSGVKFSLNAKMNMFMEMMAKKPLQQFVDLLASKIEEMDFSDK